MKLICSRFGYDIDLSAWIAPLFRGKKIGLDFELFDRLDRRPDDNRQRQPVVVVDAVIKIVVRTFPISIDEQLGPRPRSSGRVPLIMVPFAPNPVPLTPGLRMASWTKLRPLSGSSWT